MQISAWNQLRCCKEKSAAKWVRDGTEDWNQRQKPPKAGPVAVVVLADIDGGGGDGEAFGTERRWERKDLQLSSVQQVKAI